MGVTVRMFDWSWRDDCALALDREGIETISFLLVAFMSSEVETC